MPDTTHLITEKIRGWEIRLKTRAGVFAKQGVDVGSSLITLPISGSPRPATRSYWGQQTKVAAWKSY